jgi:hypothetical protein
MMSQSVGLKIGTRLPDGTMRYCNMTNGGPVFVYVKDDKIIRMTPIDFTADDPPPWTIEARGLKLTPPRKTTLAPHGQNAKSIIYSPDRLLYPMKRVDFDPNGERNPGNRGKSGYVRISWEERTYGPGVMAVSHGSHHTWGNIGYKETDSPPQLDSDDAAMAYERFIRCGSAKAGGELLPFSAVPVPQRRRLHPNPSQSRQLGRLVLGSGASLGLHAPRGSVGNLRHRRRLSEELRHDRVLGGGSRIHFGLLRRAGGNRPPAMAEESQARHQSRSR